MKVWILIGNTDYEGETFFGVFSTEEKAEEQKQKIEKKHPYVFDDFSIDQVFIDELCC